MTLGSHQKTVGDTQTWITPRWIIDTLGPFDLDPAASSVRPWDCAGVNWCGGTADDGLSRPWHGRVWLNPPFDRYEVGKWIKRLAEHRSGIALLHARTEAEWFEPVWEKARAILFLADRLYFHYPDGRRADANSGAPACLIAFGKYDARRLRWAGIAGYFVETWKCTEGASPNEKETT